MRAARQLDSDFRRRRDCFIFFYIIQYGWGKAERPSPHVFICNDSPVSKMIRLGLPTRRQIGCSCQRVRRAAPKESRQYKEAWHRFKEVRRRYEAAKTRKRWMAYLGLTRERQKKGVVYQSHVSLRRRGGVDRYRKKWKYLYHELLLRPQERKRAQSEMLDIDLEMSALREAIFAKMEVPENLRRLD